MVAAKPSIPPTACESPTDVDPQIWTVARHLKEIIDGREFERFSRGRKAIF